MSAYALEGTCPYGRWQSTLPRGQVVPMSFLCDYGCKIVMEQELLIEGDFQVLGDSSSSNGVDIPQIGMCFSAEEEVRDFYKSYAQGLGFGISKLGSKKGDDGQLKYFSFGCSKNGYRASGRTPLSWETRKIIMLAFSRVLRLMLALVLVFTGF
ncbi:hypothetical protein ZIOFF_043172 [Zingiber officinale]|uniref:Uncharacterized protein n=1 Tax=Zingiber officinale TaxID=94328 RepID=A0A8J5KTV2_ZINOF|nr:hypothetical protein ZIOFF_043172 [Zingiber officinale]